MIRQVRDKRKTPNPPNPLHNGHAREQRTATHELLCTGSDACSYSNNLSRTSAASTNFSHGSARPSPPPHRISASLCQQDISLTRKYDGGRKMALIPSQILRVAILLSYFSILCNYKAIDMPAHQTYGGSWKFLTFIDLVSACASFPCSA